MDTVSPLLSVVSQKGGDVVHIHANENGLAMLERAIKQLRVQLANGKCEHTHFMSTSWGSGELTESMTPEDRSAGAKQVHHLKLSAWTNEWKAKHGL